jgi:hypothetical protein
VHAFLTVKDLYPKGNNQSFSTLLALIDEMPQPLRQTLHIQADNCVAENKNQGFFFSLGLLVHYNVFETVILG